MIPPPMITMRVVFVELFSVLLDIDAGIVVCLDRALVPLSTSADKSAI